MESSTSELARLIGDYGISEDMAEQCHQDIVNILQDYKNNRILPKSYELYKWREDRIVDGEFRRENPVEFMERVWGKYRDSGALYQFQLRVLDGGLLNSLGTYCHKHGIDASRHVPPPKQNYIEKLGAASADDDLQDARRKTYAARVAKRKQDIER